MNDVVKNINGVQIATSQRVKLTKGQGAILRQMNLCIKQNKPLTWDIIVDCYYENVSKKQHDHRYIGDYWEGTSRKEYFSYDIKEAYLEGGTKWLYTVRGRIYGWLISVIGRLVIKGQLIVIPVMDIEVDELLSSDKNVNASVATEGASSKTDH